MQLCLKMKKTKNLTKKGLKNYSVLPPSLCMTTLSLETIWFTTIPYHKMPLCMLFTASKPGYILKQLQSMRRTRPTHTSSISVKIVGTGNTSSIKGTNRLQIFVIAAAFVSYETEQSYTWIMEELRGDVWPVDTDFPESQHLLCAWHLWNTMEWLV